MHRDLLAGHYHDLVLVPSPCQLGTECFHRGANDLPALLELSRTAAATGDTIQASAYRNRFLSEGGRSDAIHTPPRE